MKKLIEPYPLKLTRLVRHARTFDGRDMQAQIRLLEHERETLRAEVGRLIATNHKLRDELIQVYRFICEKMKSERHL